MSGSGAQNSRACHRGDEFKADMKEARDNYEKIRDAIGDSANGEEQAAEATERLEVVKRKYIDYYYTEHQKRRMESMTASAKAN